MLKPVRSAFKGFLQRSRTSVIEAREKARSNRQLRDFRRATGCDPDPMTPVVRADFERLWRQKFGMNISTAWHEMYAAISGIEDHRYVTREAFVLHIYQALNDMRISRAYSYKNTLDKVFPDANRPEAVLRNIHGRYYDSGLVPELDPVKRLLAHEGRELVIKPAIGTGGGRGVRFFTLQDGRATDGEETVPLDALFSEYRRDFVVEVALTQHEAFRHVYPHSVNTVRVMTLRTSGGIFTVSAVVRFGDSGRRVDNQGAGGVACGVRRNGSLNSFAVDGLGRKYERHPFTNVVFKEQRLPGIEDTFALCERLHERLLSFDLVSWDIAVGEQCEPVLVEVNFGNQEINFHQLNNGPVFGEFTEEVVDRVLAAK